MEWGWFTRLALQHLSQWKKSGILVWWIILILGMEKSTLKIAHNPLNIRVC